MCNIIIVPLCFLLYRTETVPSSVPWGIVMQMWESLDLHSLPPELQHISRNGLFPYSLWSVIKILTWYYQTHFFPNQQLYICYYRCQNFSKKGRERIVSIPHLCILCSKMKLIIPVFWMQGRGSVQNLRIRELLSTGTFQKFHPASEQAVFEGWCPPCTKPTVMQFPRPDTGAARRPEVGPLRRKPVGQSRWGPWG